MAQKLIKINQDHYIIVDDSEIQEGNWVLPIDNIPYQIKNKEDVLNFDKKITHSTQPLGIGWQQEVIELSLQEVKELIGEVDVEKKALAFAEAESYGKLNGDLWKGFLFGYNQALEDNKEKKYTAEDLRNAFGKGEARGYEARDCSEKYNPLTGYEPKNNKMTFEEFIQSLQPKTEWEVEIVDGKLKLKL